MIPAPSARMRKDLELLESDAGFVDQAERKRYRLARGASANRRRSVPVEPLYRILQKRSGPSINPDLVSYAVIFDVKGIAQPAAAALLLEFLICNLARYCL